MPVNRRAFGQLAGGLGLAAVGAGALVAVGRFGHAIATPAPFAGATPSLLSSVPSPNPGGPLPPAAPADPHATADARTLLNWLRGLRARTTHKLVTGQQIPADATDGYQQYVQRLATLTGQHPALIGVGFNDLWNAGIPPVLIEHWRAGGLVTMEFHATDPWNPAGGVNSAWVPNEKIAKPDLRQLLSDAPASAARDQWFGQRNRLANALEQLASAGVVVILRPFFENNGSWFWWGQDMTTHQTHLVELYQDLFHFITGARGLHNVLWAHSPCASWDGPMMQYYPGGDYVDVIAPTCYDDELLWLGDRPGQADHTDYQDILAAGKPLGYGECGPNTQTNGRWDTRTILDRVRQNYPAITYFDCWHGWGNTIIELVDDQHATELMNDPLVITRENIDWHRS